MPECQNAILAAPQEQFFTRETRKYIPSSLYYLGGREEGTGIILALKTCLLTSCETLYSSAGRKEATSLTDRVCFSLFPQGRVIALWGLAGAWDRMITVCNCHNFSFPTNPWSRSPDKLKFGAPVIFDHDPCSRRNLSSLVEREESFIPILTNVRNSELNPPDDLKSTGRRKTIPCHWHETIPSTAENPRLCGVWSSKIPVIHFQSIFQPALCVLYHQSSQHLEHKIAFNFHFLFTLRVKQKLQSRHYFYLANFCSDS